MTVKIFDLVKKRLKAKKTNLLLNLAFALTVALLTFILIEGLLSLLRIGPVEKFVGWGYNPECCGDLRPNQKITAQVVASHPYFIQTNSLGLRDADEVSLKPEPGKIRVLAIGDSMTFGPYVANDETWPAYLEEKFENKAEVLNAGVSAYSIKEEADYLKEKGYLLQPNLIILQFFVNDISDIAKNKTRMVRESSFSNYKYFYKIFNFFRDRSHLIALFLDKILGQNIDKLASKPDSLNQDAKNAVNFKKLSEDDFSQELYHEYESIFNQLVKFVNHNNFKLAVMIIPDLNQSKKPFLTQSISFIQDLSIRNDVPVLNLQPAFHQAGQPENLYLVPWNEHLSVAGNKLVAEKTYSFLVENNLLRQD